MELLIENGDYVRGPGGVLQTVSGTDALFQRAAMRLGTRLGEFAYDADLGSELHTLSPESPDHDRRALAMAREALSTLPEVAVLAASVQAAGCTVTLQANGKEKTVEVGR